MLDKELTQKKKIANIGKNIIFPPLDLITQKRSSS